MSTRAFLIAVVTFGATAVAVGSLLVNSADIVNALTSRAGYRIDVDLAYGGLARQKVDIYTPDDNAANADVVIFFHGGGWNKGSKSQYLFVGQSLVSAGFIVAIPNYRLHPDAVFPVFVEDAAKAVAFIRDATRKPDGTARRLFLAGHSAGAHIAALLNLDERYLADAGVPRGGVGGTVGLSGPYDFLPLEKDLYKAIFPESVRVQSQPIAFVDGTEAPMLLVTGETDRTVDPGNTTRLAAAIAAHGGVVSVKSFPGVGHTGTLAALATATFWRKPDVRSAIIDFFAAQPRNSE